MIKCLTHLLTTITKSVFSKIKLRRDDFIFVCSWRGGKKKKKTQGESFFFPLMKCIGKLSRKSVHCAITQLANHWKIGTLQRRMTLSMMAKC